jgi:hypothetical protein
MKSIPENRISRNDQSENLAAKVFANNEMPLQAAMLYRTGQAELITQATVEMYSHEQLWRHNYNVLLL